MTPSSMRIRPAAIEDIEAIVNITKANNHYWTPEVDGPDALRRQIGRQESIVLVAEDVDVLGFVLGSYDGARAFVHKISVRPDMRDRGIGTRLVERVVEHFRGLGAPTIAVAAADGSREEEQDSRGFWRKVGFEPIPARLMIRFGIQENLDENQ